MFVGARGTVRPTYAVPVKGAMGRTAYAEIGVGPASTMRAEVTAPTSASGQLQRRPTPTGIAGPTNPSEMSQNPGVVVPAEDDARIPVGGARAQKLNVEPLRTEARAVRRSSWSTEATSGSSAISRAMRTTSASSRGS
jgi:hypothetical protein